MCGCPLERLGWTTHVQSVLSREKLTAAGMTFYDVDVVKILEHVLPQRFGGGPTDYQLVEEETAAGAPVVRLLVHPAVRVARFRARRRGVPGRDRRRLGRRAHHGNALAERRAPPGGTAAARARPPRAEILHLHVDRRGPPPS